MSIGLRPYKEGDAESIITWCSDEDSFYKWSAGILGEYPITLERMEESTRGNIYPWVLFDGDKVLGYLIMRHPTDDLSDIRFGFVIVDSTFRGKGYGKRMLELGIKYAFEIYGAKRISLGVFDNNPSALHCYESVGFKPYGEIESFEVNGKIWNCIEMELKRSNI